VSEISRRLKALAKNLDVSVIALSQMNRAIEKRGTPKPVLSDLRESGQIEQDADQIIFTYRPEAILEGVRSGEADLIVEKNRGGETGEAIVAWEGMYQRFSDYYPK
jgi:replicative DNA helicase